LRVAANSSRCSKQKEPLLLLLAVALAVGVVKLA
jgi:hypothetical protein